MHESKPLTKSVISLLFSYIAGNVMCILSIAMLSVLLDSSIGKVVLQIFHIVIMFVAMYPFFYDIGSAIRLSDNFPEQRKQLFIDLKKVVALFYCIPYGSLILLILMKLDIIKDSVYIYKLLNIPIWGTLMIFMESTTILDISWITIVSLMILPLWYLLIIVSGFVFGYQDVTVRGLLRKKL